MFSLPDNSRKPFLLAIGLHLLLLLALLMHFSHSAEHAVTQSAPVTIIHAVAVNQNPSSQQPPMSKAQPVPQPVQPQNNTQPPAQTATQQMQQQETQQRIEQAQREELKEQQNQQQKLVDQQALLKQEQAKVAAHQALEQHIAAKAAQLAALKVQQEKIAQQKAIEQKLTEEKLAQEAALKQQQEKLAAEKQAALQKQKALALARKKQAEHAAKLATEQMLQQQLATDTKQAQVQAVKNETQQMLQQQLATATAAQSQQKTSTQSNAATIADQGEVDKYKALIIQAISQQWIIPDSVQKNLQGQLLVRLAPGGMVLNVQVTQSSGDAVLDRSARTAVFKASPLPVPNDSALFDRFRELNLTFQPQGILADA